MARGPFDNFKTEMMAGRPTTRWLVSLVAAGSVLAIALLVQTIVNYRYVADSLIQQSARRAAEERVRDVERAARLTRPKDAAEFQLVLEEIRADASEQIAEVVLLQSDGTLLAASSAPGAGPAIRQPVERPGPLLRESRAGRDVFVGTFICRCSLPRRAAADPAGQSRDFGRLLIRLALYEDSLSAPFSRLRRNAIVSATAALTLLVALGLIAARARSYLQGRQLQAEVRLARQVQLDLLPVAAAFPPIDMAADCLPASQVGGDFYDVLPLPDGRVSFVLGDVSGHGLSAALLMALIHGAMSNPPWGTSEAPEDSASRLNDLLLKKSSEARYASLFWCAYHPGSRTLSYLNAGHPPPVLMRFGAEGSARIQRLASGGAVLGLITHGSYSTETVQAEPGDVLVLTSDGITEASNRRGEQFGEERLIHAIELARDRPAAEIMDGILSSVAAFTGKGPAADDQTLLVVRLWSE